MENSLSKNNCIDALHKIQCADCIVLDNNGLMSEISPKAKRKNDFELIFFRKFDTIKIWNQKTI